MASSASTGVTTTASAGPQNPTAKQKILDCFNFLYNSEEGTVLGRNAKSWGQIGVFYLIYYSCLAGFIAAMIAAFYSTVDWNTPSLVGPDSLLRQNPGVGFRPLPDSKTTLVHFDSNDAATYNKYVENINNFIEAYESQDNEDTVDCSAFSGRRPSSQWEKPCKVKLTDYEPYCTKSNSYGFADGSPCILLKLNRIFDWQPQMYANNESIPDEIRSMYIPYHVTIKCEGENDADKDNIGPVTYYPSGGFHFKYFPFQNQAKYLSPIVMARFENPTKATLLMITCKAYAQNIEHDSMNRNGLAHLELIVDQSA